MSAGEEGKQKREVTEFEAIRTLRAGYLNYEESLIWLVEEETRTFIS